MAQLGCGAPTPLTAAHVSPRERWTGYPQRAYRVHTTDRGRFVELRPATDEASAHGPESVANSGDTRSAFEIFPQVSADPRAPRVFTLLNAAGDQCVVEVVRTVVLQRRLLEPTEESVALPAPRALALEVPTAGCEAAVVALPGAHSRAWLEPVPLQRSVRDTMEGITPNTRLPTTLTFSPSPGDGCPGLPATLEFEQGPVRHVSLRIEQQLIELFLVHTGLDDLVWVGHVGGSAIYTLSEASQVQTFVEMRDVGLGVGCTAGR